MALLLWEGRVPAPPPLGAQRLESIAAVPRWESLGGLFVTAGAVSRLGALLMVPGRERLG